MMRSFKALLCLSLSLFFVVFSLSAGSVVQENSTVATQEFTCDGSFTGDLDTRVLTSNGGHLTGNIVCHEKATLQNCVIAGALAIEGACMATGTSIEKLVLSGATCNLSDTSVGQLIVKAGADLTAPQTITLGGSTTIAVLDNEVPVIVIIEGATVRVEGMSLEPGSYMVEAREVVPAPAPCSLCDEVQEGATTGVTAEVNFELKNPEPQVAVVVGKDAEVPAVVSVPAAIVPPVVDGQPDLAAVSGDKVVDHSIWQSIPRWVLPACGAAVVVVCVAYVLTH